MSSENQIIAFDLETHKIQPGLLAPPIVCGSSAGPHWSDLLTKSEALKFAHWALASDCILAGANIAYDFGCLAAEDESFLPLIFAKYARKQVHDVQIAECLDFIAKGFLQDGGIIDPRTGQWLRSNGKVTNRFSLATCVDLELKRQNAKANDRFRTSYALLENIPHDQWPEDARKYPIDDAVNTREVVLAQLKTCENLHDLPAQCETAWAEHLAALWGLRTDGAQAKVTAEWLTWLKRGADDYFAKSDIYRPDGSRNLSALRKRVSDAYFGDPPKTDKGEISTARDVLEESGDEFLESFGQVSKIDKLLGTYIPFVESGTRIPINLRFNPLLANGRSSVDGLIQLLPRKGGVRECFVARPGTVWCSVDYSAIELSTLAQVCLWTVGYSNLADAINGGMDCHAGLASEIFVTPYEEILAKVKARNSEWIANRTCAKAANFGYSGMMGAVKFAIKNRKEGLKLCITARLDDKCGREKITEWKGRPYPPVCRKCVEFSERLRKGYLAKWSEMPRYFEWIASRLDFDGNRLTQFGSDRIRGGLEGPSGANTLFSGLAADGAKAALRAVSRECYLDTASPLYGSRPVIFAHDEIIIEMPEDKAHEAARRQTEIMLREMRECVPDVKVAAEPALMRRWYKDAGPVYKDGRLVPWEPLQ